MKRLIETIVCSNKYTSLLYLVPPFDRCYLYNNVNKIMLACRIPPLVHFN